MRDTKTNPSQTKSKLGLRPTAKAKRARKEIKMSNVNATAKSTSATYFTFDHIGKRIVGSEFNFKKSGIPGTAQYDALMTAMNAHPSYSLSPVAPKVKKQTYAGLNFDLMMDYVDIKGTEVQKAEFEEIVNSNAHFPVIKSWFVENFKCGFTVEKAKREVENAKRKIAQANLKATKANIRKVVKAKMAKPTASAVLEMPTAQNF